MTDKIVSKKLLTLCIIHQPPKVLLGMKKKGFGAGRWNGFGGKVEQGETIEAAARREVTEEAGIVPAELEKMGVILFEFQDGSVAREVHIFRVSDFSGQPVESEEMRPEWFNENSLPFDKMWTADTYWLPYLLRGEAFRGRILYDKPSSPDYASKIIERELRVVEGDL